MRLEGNKKYQVLKTDGKTITFKFIGNAIDSDDLIVNVNGEEKSLYSILEGGYLAYQELPE